MNPPIKLFHTIMQDIDLDHLKSMPNTCSACKSLLTSGLAENEIETEDAGCYDNAKDEIIFIGLLKPSDIVYITGVHAWAMYCHYVMMMFANIY